MIPVFRFIGLFALKTGVILLLLLLLIIIMIIIITEDFCSAYKPSGGTKRFAVLSTSNLSSCYPHPIGAYFIPVFVFFVIHIHNK